ncbi:N-methylhydantoinase B [Hyphomicrobiales bacterium]|nr:N-methylhydantoinase B [Hyphomicrobiales bacterium]CAH1691293.1 N-methylhydantoinase B [Hyphomicrobiales bacterium]
MNATTKIAAVDPITIEVIGSALASITEEMGEALVRASYSTNIKERRDCSTALFDARGQTLCQAEHIPMHLGSFLDFIPNILKRYPLSDIHEGDVFMGNDPYEGGGTHLPDIVLAEPIFFEGEIVAWAMNTAHHADFADHGHDHIYQEGIRLPPVRLYKARVFQEEVQAIFLLNCQVPHERVSDLRAQMAANRLGVQRMRALCEKYSGAVVRAAGDALQDYAERKMRAGIAAIPDGTYRASDMFDAESWPDEIRISCAITVAGDSITLEFDSPPQVRSGFNMIWTALLATVYYAVKSVVDPTILPNAGLARPITVKAEPGTLLHCESPAAVIARIMPCQRVVDVIMLAFSQIIPERLTAACNSTVASATFSGRRPDGSPWIYLETIGGGGGARAAKDGLDGIQVHMTNTSNLPVEAMEIEYPLTLLSYELVDGSGGAGRQIGGMGLRRTYRAEAPCRIRINMSRLNSAPWGLAGGKSGGRGSFSMNEGAPELVGGIGAMRVGDIIDIITPGGGGYGDPGTRPPELVERDIAERRFTPAMMRTVFNRG